MNIFISLPIAVLAAIAAETLIILKANKGVKPLKAVLVCGLLNTAFFLCLYYIIKNYWIDLAPCIYVIDGITCIDPYAHYTLPLRTIAMELVSSLYFNEMLFMAIITAGKISIEFLAFFRNISNKKRLILTVAIANLAFVAVMAVHGFLYRLI